MEHIVIIDEKDNCIGEEEKEKCHDGNGILHRGFLAMVFNIVTLQEKRKEATLAGILGWHHRESCCRRRRLYPCIKEKIVGGSRIVNR